MTSIYLVRHGQASFGAENYDQLSDLGHTQAHVLGAALSRRIGKIDQVYLGSMLRHRQTANNCLSHFDEFLDIDPLTTLSAIYEDGLNEYDHEEVLLKLSPGLNSMKDVIELMANQVDPKNAFRKYFADAVGRWMSGHHDAEYSESWNNFTQRVQRSLTRVIDDSATAKNIVVFTSGGPISVISQSLLGVPKEKMMQINWTLLNCGVTKLVVTSSNTFLASLNEHTHFEGDEQKHLITYT